MAKKVLSIDIDELNTYICVTDYKVKEPKVYKFERIETPEGVYVDGSINLNKDYVGAIMRILAEKRIKCRDVVFHISSSKIVSREITVPMVKDNRLMSMVKANATEYFPIELTKYRLGYIKLGTVKENDANRLRLLVLAVPLNLIESYTVLAKLCGLKIKAIDYCGNSIYQLGRETAKNNVQMIIKVDRYTSLLTVMKNQEMVLQRNIGYGINDGILEVMNNKIFACRTYRDAVIVTTRRTCTKLYINADTLIEAEEEIDSEEMSEAKMRVAAALNPLINGINRVIDYYNSRNMDAQIDRIYVTGSGSEFGGLSKLLTNELGITVKNLTQVGNMNLSRVFNEGHLGSYIGCVGAVISPMALLDDAKEKLTKEKSGGDYTILAYATLTVGIILGAALVITSYLNYRDEKARYDSNIAKLSGFDEIKSIYGEYKITEKAHSEVNTLYELTANSNDELISFIEEMEEKMPSVIQVTSFSSDAEKVNMNMKVSSKEELANVVQELRNFKAVSDIEINGVSDVIDDNNIRVVEFSVSCTYKSMEELAAEEALEAEESATE